MDEGYAVGQVFVRAGSTEAVVVCEVRGPDHPKGLGTEYGESALALPWKAAVEYAGDVAVLRERRAKVALDDAHPFDVVILCRDQPHHGDAVWRYAEGT